MLDLETIKTYRDRYAWDIIKEERVYLAGSARFLDYFAIAETILQLYHDKLVSECSMYSIEHKSEFTPEEWDVLQGIAIRKIENVDAILVIDSEHGGDTYIGDNTRAELDSIT